MKYIYTSILLFHSLFFGFISLDIFQENALDPKHASIYTELVVIFLFCFLTSWTFYLYKNKQ